MEAVRIECDSSDVGGPNAHSTGTEPRHDQPSATQRSIGTQARTWDLGGGAVAAVFLPSSLARKNVERLRRYVDVLATEAAITWDEDDSGDPPAT